MNNSEVKKLIEKYLNGTATRNEKDRLFEYYERMQANQDWRDELMGDKEETRERIFNNINHKIDEQESRSLFNIWKAAGAITLLVSTGLLSLNYLKGNLSGISTSPYQTLSANNHVIKITLDDGSKVWLNKGSKLTYPEKFGSTREVSLEGEAYFDVVHLDKQFIIRSGKMVTQVLGTSFNVQAYASQNISKVSVVSGKVGVTIPAKQQKKVVFLIRNQQVAFNKRTYSVNKATLNDATTAISWIDNKIKFRNTPLPDAMQELERIYNINIAYTDGLKSCLVFADFNRTDTAEKVLGMLAKSLGGKMFKKEIKTYYLTGRACK